MLTWLIDTDGDWVLTIVRVVLGVVLFAHGAQKLLGWYGGPGLSATLRTFRDQLRIPVPLTCLAIAAEFFGGLGLIVGFLTRIAALGVAITIASCDGNGSLEVRLFHELVWRKARPWS
jgi:putative oxidoreductase